MRVATLDLTPDLFIEFAKACKDGPPRRFVVIQNPLPDDAVIVRVQIAPLPGPLLFRLVVQSEAFEDVAEDATPPQLPDVVFQTQYEQVSELVA